MRAKCNIKVTSGYGDYAHFPENKFKSSGGELSPWMLSLFLYCMIPELSCGWLVGEVCRRLQLGLAEGFWFFMIRIERQSRFPNRTYTRRLTVSCTRTASILDFLINLFVFFLSCRNWPLTDDELLYSHLSV